MTDEPKQPIDPRGARPKTSKLTWKLLLAALPLYVGSYTLVMLAVGLVVPVYWQRLSIAGGVTVVTMTVLDLWLKPRIGLGAGVEKRERTWASSTETTDLVFRQAGRYLTVALPIITLSAVVAAVLAARILKVIHGG